MSASLPRIDFSRIREHEGSQHRAWEELAFVLTSDIEGLPPGTRLERRAAPDGGIEFSCPAPVTAPTGRWAWQAKYLFDVDSDALKQMRSSFLSALKSTPDLTRYTFILPTDRSATGAPRTTSALKKWDAAVVRWKREAAQLGRTVDIEFRGHSEVLAALQLDEHAGSVRYFFDQTMFTAAYFRDQVDREVHNLGERYDPQVNVEVDVREYLDAVSRSPAFRSQVTARFDGIDSAVSSLIAPGGAAPVNSATLTPLLTTVRSTANSLARERAAILQQVCEPGRASLNTLRSQLDRLRPVVEAAEHAVREERRALPLRERHPSGDRDTARDALDELARPLWRIQRAIDHADELLQSALARAAEVGAILLVGPAGCGKSHLLADAAVGRVAEGAPTLLLLGQHLEPGQVWPQLAAQLDVTGRRDLLGALSIAAQLRGQGRALILVDAINEGAGADIWPSQLAGFLADCARYPWIAVVLSLRDIYRGDVLPQGLPAEAMVEVHHAGLAGHEEEALARYSQHYELRMPDIPALLPELANPLFLRTMCRSVKARGLDAIPREAASMSWLFEGLVLAANTALSHRKRLDFDVHDDLVGPAVAALADAMLDHDAEALSYTAARDICRTLHADTGHSRSLLNGLLAEGLLLRERVRRPGQSAASDQVRFTYQRMADHLRAEALLHRNSQNDELATAVKALSVGDRAWRRHGLLDALVLLVGERRGVELATLLKVPPTRRRLSRDDEHLQHLLAEGFVASLPWRNPRTFSKDAAKLLDGYLRHGFINDNRWLDLLITLACVPNHPLNAERLDTALRRFSLPERDEHWSAQVLEMYSEHHRGLTRTIDWAWDTTITPEAEVARLAATVLAWLLTSPNRRLRDTATKALLNVTEGHTAVLAELVERFADVDDIYVMERVLAVACGHVVRHRDTDSPVELDDLAALAQAVYGAVFDGEVPEHLLVRHYARTAVETVAYVLRAHGRELDVDLARTRPPYGSSWPLVAPSIHSLAPGFGREPSKYLSSVGIGHDFERYVIEGDLIRNFALPNQARRQAAMVSAQRRALAKTRADLVESLPARRRATFNRRLDAALQGDGDWGEHARRWEDLQAGLSEPQLEQLQRIRGLDRKVERPGLVRPDKNLLARWIAARVLGLGWTTERFGDIDKWLSHSRSGSRSETERFGKKYVWIAYYELAGHLADHCTIGREHADGPPVPYEGPWQLTGLADIDPSVMLRGDEPPEHSPGARLRSLRLANARRNAWWLDNLRHDLSGTGTDGQWLRNTRDVPEPVSLLTVRDPNGAHWTPITTYQTWSRQMGPGTRWQDDRRELVLRIESHLVRDDQRDKIVGWLTAGDQDWNDARLPDSANPSVDLLKGYPDIDGWPNLIAALDDDMRKRRGWIGVRVGPTELDVSAASIHASSKSSRDYSAIDLRAVMLPAPALYDCLGIRWLDSRTPADALQLGRYELEFAWTAHGQLAAFASDGEEFAGPHLLLVRESALQAALADAGLCLLTTIYTEKIYWADGDPHQDRAEMHAAALLTGNGRNLYGIRRVLRRWDGNNRTMEPLG